jgi:hypothetical protein
MDRGLTVLLYKGHLSWTFFFFFTDFVNLCNIQWNKFSHWEWLCRLNTTVTAKTQHMIHTMPQFWHMWGATGWCVLSCWRSCVWRWNVFLHILHCRGGRTELWVNIWSFSLSGMTITESEMWGSQSDTNLDCGQVFYPADGCRKFRQNVGNHLQDLSEISVKSIFVYHSFQFYIWF